MNVIVLLLTAVQALDPYAPPEIRKIPTCTCPSTPEAGVIRLDGYVIDAEMTLAPDGLNTNDRMATIFDVKSSNDPSYSGRTRVWHETTEDKCGITFDYGRKYSVTVRVIDGDQLETDRCLMDQ
ncbi:hypothetical protein ABFZ85_07735 [Hyphococcus formosus]|uniref:hypothetical protein n=1 Tax=Hyphococcus formosus TaxID=3143534 RepID=UPI00398B588F